jgi:hypothetical protein
MHDIPMHNRRADRRNRQAGVAKNVAPTEWIGLFFPTAHRIILILRKWQPWKNLQIYRRDYEYLKER